MAYDICGTLQRSSSELSPGASSMVLFDATHGQSHWAQTGFTSREINTNFSAVAQTAKTLEASCVCSVRKPLLPLLGQASLLVLPPPAGKYDSRRQRWLRERDSLFDSEEILAILHFLQRGGRLLAFAYRFGDTFTETNLKDLFSPLGCHLNDDAVLDLDQLRSEHPLKSQFTTSRDLLPQPWSTQRVTSVAWRTMATFTILPGAPVQPLALSPGGRCITFNRSFREISFESNPIAVAGSYGQGRFVLFGGPHAFEAGAFGLVTSADNRQFLTNILRWLLSETAVDQNPAEQTDLASKEPLQARWREFSRIQGRGKGEKLVSFIERILKRKGVLKALNTTHWAP